MKYNPYTTEFLETCKQLCIEAHKGQTRRNGEPYSNHPIRVADMIKSIRGFNVDIINMAVCTAYLHDVLEDNPSFKDKLLTIFKQNNVEPMIMRLRYLTKKSNEDYVSYIEKIHESGIICKLVKYFDILDNLSDDPTPKQKEKYRRALNILML